MVEDAPPFLRGFRFQCSVAMLEVARDCCSNSVGRSADGLDTLLDNGVIACGGLFHTGAGSLARILHLRNASDGTDRLHDGLAVDPVHRYPALRAVRRDANPEAGQMTIPIDSAA